MMKPPYAHANAGKVMTSAMEPCLTLSDRCLEVAAGVPINKDAYTRWDLNLMRVQTMGRAFARGWLHNVLGRITPLTAYAREDYLAMADLFIMNQDMAKELAEKLNADMTAFAAAAGYYATPGHVPEQMMDHVALYRGIVGLLEQKFDFTAPAPFAVAGVVTADHVRHAGFIREFMASSPLVVEKAAAPVSAGYID